MADVNEPDYAARAEREWLREQQEPEPEPCPLCRGRRLIETATVPPGFRAPTDVCPECRGTGRAR